MTRSAPRPEPADEWVTVPVAAHAAKRKPRTVYEWVADDRIAWKREGGQLLVLKKAAVRLGQETTRGRPKSPPT